MKTFQMLLGCLAIVLGLLSPSVIFSPAAHGETSESAKANASANAQKLRVVTYNVWKELPAKTVKQDLLWIMKRSDVILLQEARYLNFHKIFPNPKGWKIVQFHGTTSRQASAILIRASAIKKVNNTWITKVSPGSSSNPNNKFPPRWIVMAHVTLKNNRTITLGSFHYPTKGWADLQSNMADRMVTVLKNKPVGPKILGGDFNFTGDKYGVANRVPHTRVQKKQIDGFYVKGQVVTVKGLYNLKYLHSDHNPVLMVVKIKAPDKLEEG